VRSARRLNTICARIARAQVWRDKEEGIRKLNDTKTHLTKGKGGKQVQREIRTKKGTLSAAGGGSYLGVQGVQVLGPTRGPEGVKRAVQMAGGL